MSIDDTVPIFESKSRHTHTHTCRRGPAVSSTVSRRWTRKVVVEMTPGTMLARTLQKVTAYVLLPTLVPKAAVTTVVMHTNITLEHKASELIKIYSFIKLHSHSIMMMYLARCVCRCFGVRGRIGGCLRVRVTVTEIWATLTRLLTAAFI